MAEKKVLKLIIVFAVIAVIFWGTLFVFAKQNFSHYYNVNGLVIASNFSDPKTYFAELGDSAGFIVSPEMHETVGAIDPYVFNGANVMSVVLNGNRKNVVFLIRVLDSEENLQYCLSNFGDVKTSEKISKEQCMEELSSEERARILFDFPSGTGSSFALVEKNKVTVKASNYSQIEGSAYVITKIMYENTDEIINNSNIIINNALQ